MEKTIQLGKSLIVKLTLICSLFLMVGFSFADNINPYAENLSTSNVNTLDDFIDLVKDKGSSLKSPHSYLSFVKKIDTKVENLYQKNLDNYKLVQILKYIRFELGTIIDSLESILGELNDYENQGSCSNKPNYENAIFNIGKPTKSNTIWQNNNSSSPCYYTCKEGFSGNDCSSQIVVSQDENIQSYEQVTPSVILAGSKDVKLIAFKISAEIDNIRISDLSFTGINLNSLSNFRLLTSSNVQVHATDSSNEFVKFTKLTNMEIIPRNSFKVYHLIADVNQYVDNIEVGVTLNVNGSSISGSSGRIFSLSGNSVFGPIHTIGESKTGIVKLSNPSKDLATSALIFSVSAFGKDQIVLSGASFNNEIVGYTGADTLTVYRNSISNSNIVGVGPVSGTISFIANNTVDSGSTQKFIVVVNGTIDSNAKNVSWTIRLNNIEIGNINASEYQNLGSFPIVETK
ncbi:MAG: hypothetical protein V3575_06310 [Candidatus Absconditabacteria bacterium]